VAASFLFRLLALAAAGKKYRVPINKQRLEHAPVRFHRLRLNEGCAKSTGVQNQTSTKRSNDDSRGLQMKEAAK
jgi:hypothetical protein